MMTPGEIVREGAGLRGRRIQLLSGLFRAGLSSGEERGRGRRRHGKSGHGQKHNEPVLPDRA